MPRARSAGLAADHLQQSRGEAGKEAGRQGEGVEDASAAPNGLPGERMRTEPTEQEVRAAETAHTRHGGHAALPWTISWRHGSASSTASRPARLSRNTARSVLNGYSSCARRGFTALGSRWWQSSRRTNGSPSAVGPLASGTGNRSHSAWRNWSRRGPIGAVRAAAAEGVATERRSSRMLPRHSATR